MMSDSFPYKGESALAASRYALTGVGNGIDDRRNGVDTCLPNCNFCPHRGQCRSNYGPLEVIRQR